MRLKSAFWVSAYIRRCQMEGATAVLRRRGAPEAGAIFIVLDTLDGRQKLYGPAPQTSAGDHPGMDRMFIEAAGVTDGVAISEKLDRELRFDPDIWVVDVEDRGGRHFLDLAED